MIFHCRLFILCDWEFLLLLLKDECLSLQFYVGKMSNFSDAIFQTSEHFSTYFGERRNVADDNQTLYILL